MAAYTETGIDTSENVIILRAIAEDGTGPSGQVIPLVTAHPTPAGGATRTPPVHTGGMTPPAATPAPRPALAEPAQQDPRQLTDQLKRALPGTDSGQVAVAAFNSST
ncbi:hypothetical protein GCM10010193_69880 [Kitasatospora atroaurantiaca]